MKKNIFKFIERQPSEHMHSFETFAFGAVTGAIGLYIFVEIFGV